MLGAAAAHADLFYSFETGLEGFTKGSVSATGPASQGSASLKAGATVGGWQWTIQKDFNGPGEQAEISSLAGLGTNAVLKFDIIVDHATSFPAGSNTWYQVNLAANSPGTLGWSQIADIFAPDGWHDQTSSGALTKTFTYSFPQLGWEPNEGWYQLHVGANSDASVPVGFYLDNVRLTIIPEPTVTGLALLGGLIVLLRRRS